MRERPSPELEETETRPCQATGDERRGKRKVHSLIDKVYSRKNLD
jgi:hypothetical protein